MTVRIAIVQPMGHPPPDDEKTLATRSSILPVPRMPERRSSLFPNPIPARGSSR